MKSKISDHTMARVRRSHRNFILMYKNNEILINCIKCMYNVTAYSTYLRYEAKIIVYVLIMSIN
jgi:hypothetical protein